MKPFHMSGRGQKALLEGREDCKSLLESWEGLGGPEEVGRPPGGPGGFESPSERWEGLGGQGEYGGPSGWSGKAERPFRKGQEELGGHSGNPGEVERAGRGREALLEGWEGSGGQREDERSSHKAGSGWEAL